MAVSAVDLRILGQVAEDTAHHNALLSSCLFQILGLSVILSQQLNKARSQRRLDYTRNTKSIKLYHHIIWLAREGLSITEVFILPYCQDGTQGPECRVLAAKMRASFYHIFCLFHNHPPLFQMQPSQHLYKDDSTLNVPGGDRIAQVQKDAGQRDSMVSESSYITNPFATAQSPPPSYPIPPLPMIQTRSTPARPPGFSPQQRSPPSSATYLLPPLNFVPVADNYFRLAYSIAIKLLRGAHPLRLSVAHEYTAFLHDCAKDYEWANQTAIEAVRAAYSDQSHLSDKEWEEVFAMVRALTALVQRSSERRGSSTSKSSPRTSNESKSDGSNGPAPTRPLPTPPPQAAKSSSIKRDGEIMRTQTFDEVGATTPRSETLVNSPATALFDPYPKTSTVPPEAREEGGRRSQTSSKSSRRGRQEGNGSEKERKRRAVEQAELDLAMKSSGQSRTNSNTSFVRPSLP